MVHGAHCVRAIRNEVSFAERQQDRVKILLLLQLFPLGENVCNGEGLTSESSLYEVQTLGM